MAERLGNVDISGLSLSPSMRADLAGGMSASAFNAKYSKSSGFKPISLSRQLGAAPASAPGPAGPAPKSAQQIYDETVAAERTRIDQQLAAQKAEQEGLFSQFTNLQQGQEALPALYQRLEQEAGIPELSKQAQSFKDQIFRVKSLLDRIGEDVTARTTGYNVTEAQRRALEAGESEKLNTQLGRLGTGLAPVAEMLTSAQGRLGTMMSLNVQEQEQELEPVKMRINALSDRFARELSGYSEQREMTLTNLLDKLERERFLSDRDWELAQQLAAEERNFSRQKQLAKIQLGNQIQPANTSRPSAPQPAPTRQLPQETPARPDLYVAAPKPTPKLFFESGTTGDPLGVMKRLQVAQ